MVVIGIDPGPEKSGVVVFNASSNEVIWSADDLDNKVVLVQLREGGWWPHAMTVDVVFVETIEAMGLTVGKSTFQTMKWVGRFIEAWEGVGANCGGGGVIYEVSRGDEKVFLCGAVTFRNPSTGKSKAVSDAQIKAAIKDKFPATGGGKNPVVGTKRKPGPLYGVKGHAWSALAVALTGLETMRRS